MKIYVNDIAIAIESIIANEELAKAWGTIAFDMYEGGKNYV